MIFSEHLLLRTRDRCSTLLTAGAEISGGSIKLEGERYFRDEFQQAQDCSRFRLGGRIYGFDKRNLARASSAPQQRINGRKAGRKPFGILPKNVLLVIDPFE